MRYTLTVNYSGTDEGHSDAFENLGDAMDRLTIELRSPDTRSHKQVLLVRDGEGLPTMTLWAATVPSMASQVEQMTEA